MLDLLGLLPACTGGAPAVILTVVAQISHLLALRYLLTLPELDRHMEPWRSPHTCAEARRDTAGM